MSGVMVEVMEDGLSVEIGAREVTVSKAADGAVHVMTVDGRKVWSPGRPLTPWEVVQCFRWALGEDCHPRGEA